MRTDKNRRLNDFVSFCQAGLDLDHIVKPASVSVTTVGPAAISPYQKWAVDIHEQISMLPDV
jgi:hypothetical protein